MMTARAIITQLCADLEYSVDRGEWMAEDWDMAIDELDEEALEKRQVEEGFDVLTGVRYTDREVDSFDVRSGDKYFRISIAEIKKEEVQE